MRPQADLFAPLCHRMKHQAGTKTVSESIVSLAMVSLIGWRRVLPVFICVVTERAYACVSPPPGEFKTMKVKRQM